MEAVQNSNFEIKFRACGSDNDEKKITKIASGRVDSQPLTCVGWLGESFGEA